MARTPGSKNQPKRRLLAFIQEHFPDYNPLLELAKTANDPNADAKLRFDANKEIAQYVEAKRKAVESTSEVTHKQAVVSDKPMAQDDWERQYSADEDRTPTSEAPEKLQ